MPPSSSPFSIVIILAAAAAMSLLDLVSAGTQTISYPSSSPTNAFSAPADFVAVGFEAAFLDNFANSPDNFAQNLLASLSARTGGSAVQVRVGGTSGDQFTVNPDLGVAKECKEGECPNGSSASFELGPKYFESFSKFENVRWTFQAPLGGADTLDVDRTLSYVRPAWQAAGGKSNVAAIALGNEPSVYYKSAKEYIDAARSIQNAIIEDLGLEGDAARVFQWGESIAGAARTGDPYAIRELYEAGLGSVKNVKLAGEHYYQIKLSEAGGEWNTERLQAEMLNHTAIEAKLSNYVSSASYLSSSHPNVDYVISESGAALGLPIDFSGGFGSTLWSVDFLLTALSNGIRRVVDSGRPAARQASFIPDNSAASTNPGPRVQAPWSANMFVADFIGGGGEVDVSGVEVAGHRLSAHAAWDSTGIKRLALVNLRAWNGSAASEGERGEEVFKIPVTGGIGSVKVRRLHADLGVGALGFDVDGADGNITWAGEQWSYGVDQGKGHFVGGGGVREETHKVEDGEATVRVKDAEAVIVFIG